MNTQVITQELREWIVAQARAGCRPEDVLQSMRSSGWDEDTALDALETTLEQYLAAQQPKQPVLPAPVPVPEPDLAAAPSLVQTPDRAVEIVMAMRSPRLIVFGGLLSDDECDQMIGLAQPRLVRSETVHNASGGSEVHELAFVLACGVAYLRAIEGAGIPLEAAQGMVYARLAADADQFLTMAKFRALRLLWARIETACGLTPKPLFIAADTAWRMLTQRDPYVNMLRATIATFAAGLAGANAITVLPHTLALGLPDAFARRAARNTQLVLLEESNLAKVSDPAAGSGGIETLTQQLCEAAWSLFQEIEKAGGLFAALEQNLIQRKVAATRAVRETNVAKRRDVLTGASEFPNLHEAEVAVLDATPIVLPPYGEASIKFDPLPPMRLAAPFEALRDKSDAKLKGSGARPTIFLANLGTPADFTARATFAKSFFETGGIEALDTQGFADPAALATAFKGTSAAVACLCSSDKVYGGHAEAAAKALQAAGAKHIYMAGRPGEQEAALRTAGVGDFIFAGGDALKMLQDAWKRME